MAGTAHRHPRDLALLVLAAVALVLCAWQLGRVSRSEGPSIEQLVEPSLVAQIEAARRPFGVADGALVMVVAVDQPSSLAAVTRATESRLRRVEGVTRTWSWTSRPRIVYDPHATPSLRLDPAGDAEGPPTEFDRLLRPHADTAVLLAELAPASRGLTGSQRLVESLEGAMLGTEGRWWAIGPPILRVASWAQVRDDLWVMVPLLCVVAVGVPWMLFGRPSASVFPLVVAVLTAAGTTAAFVTLQGTVTPLVVVLLPLWWAVATLDAIHLYQRVGCHPTVAAAVRSLFGPCAATTITTAGSLLALALLGDSPLLRTFGWWGAAGTAVAFAVTFVFGPPLLSLLQVRAPPVSTSRVLLRIADAARRRRLAVVLGFAAMSTVAVGFATTIRPAVRYPEIFVAGHPVGKAARHVAEAIESDLLPLEIYLIPLDERHRRPGQVLAASTRLSQYLATLPETRFVLGPSTLLEELLRDHPQARRLGGGPDPMTRIEEQAAAVLEDPATAAWLDARGGSARIQLHLRPTTLGRRAEIATWIEHFDRTNLDGFELVLGGPGLLFPRAEADGLAGLWKGVAATFALLLLTLAVTLPRRALLPALVVNILPIGLVAGLMGALEIPWTLGLLAVPVVLAGLSIDDSIHMLWPLRTDPDPIRATTLAIERSGVAILATSGVLMGCLATLGLSALVVNRELGLLFSAGIGAALVCDLVLLPALLRPARGIES